MSREVTKPNPTKKLHHHHVSLFDSHDDLVIEILCLSPNTKCEHQIESIDLNHITKNHPRPIMDSPIMMILSKFQLATHISWPWATSFSIFSNDPRPTSWSAHLAMLVLTTSFKCSLKIFLTFITLCSPPTVMALTHVHCWVGWCFLGTLLLKAPDEEHTFYKS